MTKAKPSEVGDKWKSALGAKGVIKDLLDENGIRVHIPGDAKNVVVEVMEPRELQIPIAEFLANWSHLRGVVFGSVGSDEPRNPTCKAEPGCDAEVTPTGTAGPGGYAAAMCSAGHLQFLPPQR